MFYPQAFKVYYAFQENRANYTNIFCYVTHISVHLDFIFVEQDTVGYANRNIKNLFLSVPYKVASKYPENYLNWASMHCA